MPSKFSVHKKLICDHSPFFDNAINGEFKEAKKQHIDLPEDTKEVFETYLTWIYRDIIASPYTTNESGTSAPGEELDLLVDSYIFGDKVQDMDFADAIMDVLIERIWGGHCWNLLFSTKAYECTTPQSPLRRFVVDVYVWRGWEGLFNFHAGGRGNLEFFADMSLALHKRLMEHVKPAFAKAPKSTNPLKIPNCDYHQHKQHDKPCYRTKMGIPNPT